MFHITNRTKYNAEIQMKQNAKIPYYKSDKIQLQKIQM